MWTILTPKEKILTELYWKDRVPLSLYKLKSIEKIIPSGEGDQGNKLHAYFEDITHLQDESPDSFEIADILQSSYPDARKFEAAYFEGQFLITSYNTYQPL